MAILARAAVVLAWPHQRGVPPDGFYLVFANGGDGGAVDYDAAISRRIPARPDAGQYLGGFGYGPFGTGAFGYGQAGIGFGHGPFGHGPFGFGSRTMTHKTRKVADGDWTFAVVGYDAAGNGDTSGPPTAQVNVAGTPRRAADLAADAYDDGTDTLTLSWTLSPDDQAA